MLMVRVGKLWLVGMRVENHVIMVASSHTRPQPARPPPYVGQTVSAHRLIFQSFQLEMVERYFKMSYPSRSLNKEKSRKLATNYI